VPSAYRESAQPSPVGVPHLDLRGPRRGALCFGVVAAAALGGAVATGSWGPLGLTAWAGILAWVHLRQVRRGRALRERLHAFLGREVRLLEGGAAMVSLDGRRGVDVTDGELRCFRRGLDGRVADCALPEPTAAPWEAAPASRLPL
jgi:hypothetical protein